ncbi:hypothetical protein [Polaribacter marinivivus]|uniref:TraB/GumN family protein n=1 Tax=Polaribacter marinivivus TaxID=1524260 RepID=A0ABV8RA22_9FLAO
MKTKITLLIILLATFFTLSAQKTQQEIVIIGTMHTVPKIVKHSYKPMLRFAKKYNPENIFVESPMPNDTISWEYLKKGWSKGYQKFYAKSDSIKKVFDFNETTFKFFAAKKYANLSPIEIDYLIKSYLYLRDNGNYELLTYLKKYGIKGANKPTRHEDGDLTYKLALYKNMKVLNVDDQQTNGEYHEAWRKCVKEGINNGNNAANQKLNKKNYNSAILPAIFRKLGKHTNKRKSLQQLHDMASFSYVVKDTKGCAEGRDYFNQRNMRIAKNIAEQILATKKTKNIVMIGAAHVIGLEKELKENYPNLKVILMNEY